MAKLIETDKSEDDDSDYEVADATDTGSSGASACSECATRRKICLHELSCFVKKCINSDQQLSWQKVCSSKDWSHLQSFFSGALLTRHLGSCGTSVFT
jgi:hypothetical protein